MGINVSKLLHTSFVILFFIICLCVALCLNCWGCHSSESWQDCESKLVSTFCHDDEEYVCQIEVLTITTPEKSSTHYLKMCGLRSQCDGSECNRRKGNQTEKCVFHCCCHDNCNTGILGVGDAVGEASRHLLSAGVMVPLVICLYSILT